MTGEDRAATLAALDVTHAVLDGDERRVAQLVDEHGHQAVILGLARVVCGLGQQQCGTLGAFRGFLHRWAVDLQMADAVAPGGEG